MTTQYDQADRTVAFSMHPNLEFLPCFLSVRLPVPIKGRFIYIRKRSLMISSDSFTQPYRLLRKFDRPLPFPPSFIPRPTIRLITGSENIISSRPTIFQTRRIAVEKIENSDGDYTHVGFLLFFSSLASRTAISDGKLFRVSFHGESSPFLSKCKPGTSD